MDSTNNNQLKKQVNINYVISLTNFNFVLYLV